MDIGMIWACGKNGEIGKDNNLLWHLPSDFAHFKKTTVGSIIIMGRRTMESLKKPLPNRRNLVLSSHAKHVLPGFEHCGSLEDILLKIPEDAKLWIIGGAFVYEQFLPIARHLSITRVDAVFPEADTFFQWIPTQGWKLIKKEFFAANEKNKYDFWIEEWQKF